MVSGLPASQATAARVSIIPSPPVVQAGGTASRRESPTLCTMEGPEGQPCVSPAPVWGSADPAAPPRPGREPDEEDARRQDEEGKRHRPEAEKPYRIENKEDVAEMQDGGGEGQDHGR